jgi:hypothetical protein
MDSMTPTWVWWPFVVTEAHFSDNRRSSGGDHRTPGALQSGIHRHDYHTDIAGNIFQSRQITRELDFVRQRPKRLLPTLINCQNRCLQPS